MKSEVFMDDELTEVAVKDVKEKIVETHSSRKFALTYTRRSGCNYGVINANNSLAIKLILGGFIRYVGI